MGLGVWVSVPSLAIDERVGHRFGGVMADGTTREHPLTKRSERGILLLC